MESKAAAAQMTVKPEADGIEILKHREDSFASLFLDQTALPVKVSS